MIILYALYYTFSIFYSTISASCYTICLNKLLSINYYKTRCGSISVFHVLLSLSQSELNLPVCSSSAAKELNLSTEYYIIQMDTQSRLNYEMNMCVDA